MAQAEAPRRRLRAYKFALDPTEAQLREFEQHAGSARWAYNHANAILSRYSDTLRNRWNTWIAQHHGLSREQLYALPDRERIAIQAAARAAVRAENAQLAAELRIIDDHRKRVTHKGKSSVEPGEQPAEDAPELAYQLWRERVELAQLHAEDPQAYRAERKRILDEIRPLVNATKRKLIEQGAYRPTAMDISTLWREIRDLPPDEGGSPWWPEVSIYAFTSGFAHAETAWKNYLESLAGRRAGRPVGKPRFKKKRRSRRSFTLYGSVKLVTYRRIQVPSIGSVRLHGSAKRLHRALERRGGIIKSITISQGGHRWYASVLVDELDITPGRETQRGPSRRQRDRGAVGVDLGVHHLVALSDPNEKTLDNPRHLRKARKRLLKAQRAMSRRRGPDKRTGQEPSRRWVKARNRVARLHHELAVRRAGHLHEITKRLATSYELVAIEDLNVAGMTRSARGTIDQPGRGVRAKAGLNRSILDTSPAEFRRQLQYKASWYGATVAVIDRWAPTSRTCSSCGAVKAKLSLAERTFFCEHCGMELDRDINAARNILAFAQSAYPGEGKALNACGGSVSPGSQSVVQAGADEAGRPARKPRRSSRGSDPPATPTTRA